MLKCFEIKSMNFLYLYNFKPTKQQLNMKKITLLSLTLSFFAFTSNAQSLASCKQTCEIEKVIQEGPFLGVKIANVSACSNKVLVQEIIENSAAEKFGLQKGDYILSIDGKDMENTTAVVSLITSHQPSDVISVIISRSGEDVIKDIVIGAQKTSIKKETVCCDKENKFLNDLNISLSPNPTSDLINVSLADAKPGKYTFQAFNSIGVEVFVTVESIEGQFSKQFDVSKIAAGQYFLKISEGEDSYTTSFVVNK